MDAPLKLAILGDICPTQDYRSLFDNNNAEQLLGEAASILRGADLAIGNLEAPATASVEAILKTGPSLKALKSDLDILKSARIGVLSLANNHILDYGAQGVLDTLEHCEKLGIHTVGAGSNADAAKKPLFLNIKGRKIGILSFAEAEFNLAAEESAGANGFDYFDSIKDIQQAKKYCDYLIVLYHGGIEHHPYPSPLLQKKCRAMAEFGADLVLCQHSHCIGTYEQLHGSTILYGQGNSVFGHQPGNDEWNEGLLVEVAISGQGEREIEFVLLNATVEGIRLANKQKTEERLKMMAEMSLALKDPGQIEELWKEFSLGNAPLYYPLLYGRGRIFTKLNRILNNGLINLIYSQKERRMTMNLIRCDAHNEVVQTILKEKALKRN